MDRDLGTFWQGAPGDTTTQNRTPFFEVNLPSPATVHEVRIRGRRDGLGQPPPSGRRASRYGTRREPCSGPPKSACRRHRSSATPTCPCRPSPGPGTCGSWTWPTAGWPSLAEVYVMGEMPGAGPARAAVVDPRFTGRAVLAGRVLRADGSAVPGGSVRLDSGGESSTPPPALPEATTCSRSYRRPPTRSRRPSARRPHGHRSQPHAAPRREDDPGPRLSGVRSDAGCGVLGGEPARRRKRGLRAERVQHTTVNSPTYFFGDLPPATYAVTATRDRRSPRSRRR